MKQEGKGKLIRKVTIRFREDEYKKIYTAFKSTTCRQISAYIRNILLSKPVTVYTRNKSLDDFVAEMIVMRSELKAIGNNFNQSVKKLHMMDKDPEIKTWALLNEYSKQLFMKKADEIFSKMIQIEDKWSQE